MNILAGTSKSRGGDLVICKLLCECSFLSSRCRRGCSTKVAQPDKTNALSKCQPAKVLALSRSREPIRICYLTLYLPPPYILWTSEPGKTRTQDQHLNNRWQFTHECVVSKIYVHQPISFIGKQRFVVATNHLRCEGDSFAVSESLIQLFTN
jgi:hypothetical protein